MKREWTFWNEIWLVLLGGVLLLGPNVYTQWINREVISIAYQADVCKNMIALSPKIKEKIKITFDMQEAKSAFFYKATVENDGNKPMTNLPIAITVNSNVEISNLPEIMTRPEQEFGEVKFDSEHKSENKLRYVIGLFNPKDQITFEFWGFSKKELLNDEPKIYSKIPNLKIHSKVEKPEEKGKVLKLIGLILGIMSFVLALIGLIKKTTKRKILLQVSKEEIAATEKNKQEIDINQKKELPDKLDKEGEKNEETKESGEKGLKANANKTDDDATKAYFNKKEAEGDEIFDGLIKKEKDPKEILYLQARRLYLKALTINTNYINEIKKLVSENPSEFWPTFYVALGIFFEIKDYSLAERYFLKAKDLAPNLDKELDCLIYLSDCQAKLNRNQEALLILQEGQKSLQLNDDQKSKILIKIGDLYKDLGFKKRFFIAYEECLRLDPLNSFARFNLAFSYAESGFNKLSAYHYLQNCEIKKENETGSEHNNLALEFSKLGMPIKSIENFKKAIELGNSKAPSNLASRLLESGFLDEANEYLDKEMRAKQKGVDQRIYDVFSKMEANKKNENQKLEGLLKEGDIQRRYHCKAFEALNEYDIKKIMGNWSINNVNFNLSLKGSTLYGLFKKNDWDSEEIEGEIIGRIIFFSWKEKTFGNVKECKGILILIDESTMEGYIDKLTSTDEIVGHKLI